MRLDQALIAKIIEDIDITKYELPIQKAVDAYFKSDEFKEDFAEGMRENNVGYDFGSEVAKKASSAIKGKLKVNIG